MRSFRLVWRTARVKRIAFVLPHVSGNAPKLTRRTPPHCANCLNKVLSNSRNQQRRIRQSLKGVLEDEGYEAQTAESGEACLESLRRRPFDIVLLDIWL